MKKIWKFIIKYRVYIMILLVLIIGGFSLYAIKEYLYPNNSLSIYGDRLDGINEVTITDNRKTDVINYIKEKEELSDANVSVRGKIINISITATTKELSLDKIKEYLLTIVDKFTDKEVAFYDFQFFVKNADANYNLIGYKNKNSKTISFSEDEIVSEVEDENEVKEEQ